MPLIINMSTLDYNGDSYLSYVINCVLFLDYEDVYFLFCLFAYIQCFAIIEWLMLSICICNCHLNGILCLGLFFLSVCAYLTYTYAWAILIGIVLAFLLPVFGKCGAQATQY
jgi:hypothetical protein